MKASLKLFAGDLRESGTPLLSGAHLLSSKSGPLLSKTGPLLSKTGALILRVRGADASIKPWA